MKRIVRAFVLAIVLLLTGRLVWAVDTVYFQEPGKKTGDNLDGIIEKEDPTGIKLKTKTGVKDIPALQITRITYSGKDVLASEFRKPDNTVEKALRDGVKADQRAEFLKEALLGFLDLDAKFQGDAKIHRYLQYKIAHTTALQAKDDATRVDAAIKLLTESQGVLIEGWEAVPALQLLARLQEEKGDAEGASKTYSDLAEVPGLPAAEKLQNQLLGARLLLRVNKFSDAEAKLKQLESAMSKGDPQRTFVDVYLAQSQMAQKRFDGIEAKLKAAILANEDKNLRALSHNILGDYYRIKGEKDLAFWEYLKVDTLYNEDKEEHAKALYYLSQLFDVTKNDRDRAAGCLAKLKSKDYDGTLYQRLAASEKKTP